MKSNQSELNEYISDAKKEIEQAHEYGKLQRKSFEDRANEKIQMINKKTNAIDNDEMIRKKEIENVLDQLKTMNETNEQIDIESILNSLKK